MTLTRLVLTGLFGFLCTAPAWAAPVVMIGDSITCGPFGERMLRNLERGGQNDVTQYCMVGSTPQNWVLGTKSGNSCQMRTSGNAKLRPCPSAAPKLSTLLASSKGAQVVVALGTNSTPGSTIDRYYGEMATQIKAAGRTCQWILPPHMNAQQSKGWKPGHVALMDRNLPSISRAIRSAVGNGRPTTCRPIESGAATAAGTAGNKTTDGVHRGREGGFYWADAIMGDVLKEASEELPGDITPAKTSKRRSAQ